MDGSAKDEIGTPPVTATEEAEAEAGGGGGTGEGIGGPVNANELGAKGVLVRSEWDCDSEKTNEGSMGC